MRNGMKIKGRNRAETQSGNEESEEGKSGGGEDGETRRGGDKENIFTVPLSPCPLVSPSLRPHSPASKLSVQLTP
jgi:hypothetical protein